MPAIKVYKHNSVMIPVDDAKKAKAYICPWTNELYATKRSYVSHLKRLRTERMHKRAREIRHTNKLQDMWNQPDFDSVIKWIHNNPEVFWLNAKRRGWDSNHKKWESIRDTFVVNITGLKLTYTDRVSNSHSSPYNGVTNWGGDTLLKDGTPAPRGYPGFTGRIELHMPVEPLSFSSDVFKGTRIHTGSGGGGGGGHYGYSVSFFLDDWPGIANRIRAEKEAYEKEHFLDMIENKYKPFKIKDYNYGKTR
jgi:hypothetical protein